MKKERWILKNNSFSDKKGILEFNGRSLQEVANEQGTPLYVYDLNRISNNYMKVKNTLEKYTDNNLNVRVYYAMKANGANEILLKLKGEYTYIDTSSIGEIKRALRLGFKPSQVIFTGTNFGLDNFDFLAKSGILINVDSFSQIKRLSTYAPLDISIRLNPNIAGVGFNDKFDMSGSNIKSSRLGIFEDEILNAFETAKSYGLNPICLHQHVGSNWLKGENFQHFFKSVEVAISVVKKLEFSGYTIKMLNLGGGLGVQSHYSYPEFPLDKYAKELITMINNANLNIETIAIEPGRYITSDAGVLLARVNMVEQKNEVNYVGVDTGFNAFNHKMVYGIKNTVENVSKWNSNHNLKNTYAVVGNLGEQEDVFDENAELPNTDEGDVIMLYPTGAYCASELASHHFLPVPNELFIDNGR